ncbi:MAG TPA: DNA repair protein RadA, partial [Cyclobacteriaceae bacterium]|nr:DNA repair protein RadA [Cyclobacteriaceae bacterium]
MAKSKTLFFCQSCGYESPKWIGKCPSCGSWNSFVEEVVSKNETDRNDWRQDSTKSRVSKPKTLNEIESTGEIRIATPDQELNR